MNVVFLSPHFPPGMYLYAQRLKAAGARVLAIADVASESLRPELREALSAPVARQFIEEVGYPIIAKPDVGRADGGRDAAKGSPAIADEWGQDVNHDWPWWRQMLAPYLERLGV